MIIEHLPTKRAKTPYVVSSFGYKQNRQLSQPEYLRRNKLIKELADKCGYKYGDMIRPVKDDAFEKEGCYRCLGVFDSWYTYKGKIGDDLDVDWPKNDNPLLVTAMGLKTNVTIEATTNYFRKATPEEEKNENARSS